jgi:glycosyltransferase involved in cell wall biosynthesis
MGAPQGRLSELGEHLIDLGWEVEALTALPNYPTGHIFDGYSSFCVRVEWIGRIRTVRVPMWPSKGGVAKRIGSYLSFVATASYWGPKLSTRPDILFVESPPLFILYAAWRLARKWRCPYVLNVSDLWPESVVRMRVISGEHLAIRLAERLERQGYERAAGVTGQSNGIIEGVLARAPKTKTCLVTNGVDLRRFTRENNVDARARQILGEEPGPVFVFAGLFGLAQGLDQILDVAKRLPSDLPGRFVLIGDGPVREHLTTRIRNERIARVRLVAPQPRECIPGILAAADAAVITLGMSIPGAVPSKIYEAMAAGLPVIIVADREPVDRVMRAECGIGVPPGDLDRLEQAVTRLICHPELRDRLGRNGRHVAETTYDRRKIAALLSEFLRTI